jgi:hypothetical protein
MDPAALEMTDICHLLKDNGPTVSIIYFLGEDLEETVDIIPDRRTYHRIMNYLKNGQADVLVRDKRHDSTSFIRD